MNDMKGDEKIVSLVGKDGELLGKG